MKTKDLNKSVGLILTGCFGIFLLITNSCMVGPTFHHPESNVPSSWVGVTEKEGDLISTPTAQPSDLKDWWSQFKDPQLDALVKQATEQNLTLKNAVAVLRQARAARGAAAAGLWPAVTASGSYQRGHSAETMPVGQVEDLFQVGLDAAWELDFFGGVRRNVESAEANIEAATQSIHDAEVTLVAEVALDYIELRGYQQEILVARNNLKSQQHTADITRKLYNVGFNSGLDVANADANVATTESQIPVFETSARQSIYALGVLLGKPPGDLVKELSPDGDLPKMPLEVPSGLPSELLRRRPDIRVAEAQLHAATAQIGVAVAALFPQISLTGSINWESNLVSSLWAAAGRSYSVGPSVTWPVFQGGALISNVRIQEALRDQAFFKYQITVLGAFQDVENALIAFKKEQTHRKILNDAVVANRKAVDLSLKLYTAGQIDFLNVLVAQRSLYTSEDALIQSDRNVVIDLIALYKALGGGWKVKTDFQ